jgi:flavodoxin
VNAVVIYESLTGNTAKAAAFIAAELRRHRFDTVVMKAGSIDSAAVVAADLVVIGTWVKGHFVVRQRPAGAKRLRQLPQLDGKRVVTFCTYALNPGTTLERLDALVGDCGGQVVGGLALNQRKLEEHSYDLVRRALSALELTV